MLVMLALVVVAVIVNGHSSPTSVGRPTMEGSNPTGATTQSPSGPRSLTSDQQLELEQGIGRMREVVPVQGSRPREWCNSVTRVALCCALCREGVCGVDHLRVGGSCW